MKVKGKEIKILYVKFKKQTGIDRNRQEQTETDRNRQKQTGSDRIRKKQTGIENYCIIKKFIS